MVRYSVMMSLKEALSLHNTSAGGLLILAISLIDEEALYWSVVDVLVNL